MYKISRTVLILTCILYLFSCTKIQNGRKQIILSGSGWNLIRDTASGGANVDTHLYLYHDSSNKYKRDDNPAILDDNIPGNITIEQLRQELPDNRPSGGWNMLDDKNKEASVSVPGTVDEYLWEKSGGPYFGVSWWWRPIEVPGDWEGKEIILKMRATTYRAEIFIDETLVRYDMVAGTPYEVNISDYIKAGETKRLAVRITNPGGFFSWDDNSQLLWGKSGIKIFPEHGFSGINGDVILEGVDPVYIEDIYIENTPAENFRKVKCHVAINNTTSAGIKGNLTIHMRDKENGKLVYSKVIPDLDLIPGIQSVTDEIIIPDAKLWDIYQGNLYQCEVLLNKTELKKPVDNLTTDFGFRWITVKGYNSSPEISEEGNANIYLNGRRIRFFSAISWGFWPTNGLFPEESLAQKNIDAAKKLGLNMLYHHRHLAAEQILAPTDRAGLMSWCEMGGIEHTTYDFTFAEQESRRDNEQREIGKVCKFNQAINRQKVLRSVKRDRNHPSVVVHCMVNEALVSPSVQQEKDMEDAHTLAPDRILVWTGGQTFTPGGNENENGLVKSWYNSGDRVKKTFGWADEHGTIVRQSFYDEMYNSPTDYKRYSVYNKEVRGYSEEAAVGSPARYDMVKKFYDDNPGFPKGWEGEDHIRGYHNISKYLETSGMGEYFTVGSLLDLIGNKTYYLQGRRLENFKISNSNDFYITNGWENDKNTSLSGYVDIYRNIKASNISLLTDYSRPLYIAVKLRNKVVHTGDTVTADFYIVNEGVISNETGELKVTLTSPSGIKTKVTSTDNFLVKGGDDFSQLILKDVLIPLTDEIGYFKVDAGLVCKSQIITGKDEILAVNWKSTDLSRNGAIIGNDTAINRFLKREFGFELAYYNPSMVGLDYLICYGDNIDKSLTAEILEKVKAYGTKLILLEAGENQFNKLVKLGVLYDAGRWNTAVGVAWLGGAFFVGEDKLFAGLPQKTVLDWEYQNLYSRNPGPLHDDSYNIRCPLLDNMKPLVAVWSGSAPMQTPLTAMFAKSYGNGTIIFSMIPILENLNSNRKGTPTMIKLFLNCITNNPEIINQ